MASTVQQWQGLLQLRNQETRDLTAGERKHRKINRHFRTKWMRENGLDQEREKTLRRFTALNEILRFHSFLPIYFEGGIEGVFRDFHFARTYGSGQKRDLSGFFLSGPFNGSRGRGALTSHSQRKGVISSFL